MKKENWKKWAGPTYKQENLEAKYSKLDHATAMENRQENKGTREKIEKKATEDKKRKKKQKMLFT